MKTNQKLKGLSAFVVVSLTVAACGGDGSSRRLSRSNLDAVPTEITFIDPPENQEATVCLYTPIRFEVPNEGTCDKWANVNSYISGGSDNGSGLRFKFDEPARIQTNGDVCTITTRIRRLTADERNSGQYTNPQPDQRYVVSKVDSPSGTLGSAGDSVFFRTVRDYAANQECRGANFYPTRILGITSGGIFGGSDPAPRKIDVGGVGTLDSEGDWNWNAQQLVQFGAQVGTNTFFQEISNFGAISGTSVIRVQYNENIDPYSIPGSIEMYRFPSLADLQDGADWTLGDPVNLTQNCPTNSLFGDNSCINYASVNLQSGGAVDHSMLEVKMPGSGLTPGTYALMFTPSAISKDSGANQDSAYFMIIRVGQ